MKKYLTNTVNIIHNTNYSEKISSVKEVGVRFQI
jgi:hypothetical protein